MKIKIKLSLLFVASLVIAPITVSNLGIRSFAQEDTSIGWIPDYAIDEIEKLRGRISDEQWKEIERFIELRNYYGLKHFLITMGAASGGWVSIVISNILGAFFTK